MRQEWASGAASFKALDELWTWLLLTVSSLQCHYRGMEWTLPELTAEAGAALSGQRAPVSGRVRELPNERTVRWYVTIGLVDPPLGRRGRLALYGPRHLLQLVAVKRRQAEGRSIADIQAELAGATDETLREIAGIAPPDGPAAARPATRRFWTERPHGDEPVGLRRPHERLAEVRAPDAPSRRRRAELSTEPRSAPSGTDERWTIEVGSPPGRAGGLVQDGAQESVQEGAHEPGAREGRAGARLAGVRHDEGAIVHGLRLTPGATLILDTALSADDAAAILAAAGPLVDLLTERGLA
jgi:DNA-binding transcriptional MerR regulator